MSAAPFIGQAAWARELHISVRTFRRWREAGHIPEPLPLPGRPRWSRAVADAVTAKLLKNKRHKYFWHAAGLRAERGLEPLKAHRRAGASGATA